LQIANSSLKIFINYRHEDVPSAAWVLYQGLAARFGSENIFFDQGALRPGTQFLEEMAPKSSGTAGALLILIGPSWLSALMTYGQRDTEDYVVQEIDLALQNGWTVIPVLVDDASIPDPLGLPRSIRALPALQTMYLRQTNLDDDIGNLCVRLDELRVRTIDVAPAAEDARAEHASGSVMPGVFEPAGVSADDEHYHSLIDEADNLVIFLGAEVNSDDRDGPFQVGSSMLPDDADLAEFLAARARLTAGGGELAEVAQYVRVTRGEPNVSRWIKQAFVADQEPGPVHRYLASLPDKLERKGFDKCYQMIVTPNFDIALEEALRRAGEPFDVAIYMAAGTEYSGKFVHLPWDSVDPQPILVPNEYTDFPFVDDDGRLARTMIVRINGAIDRPEMGYPWRNNLIVTEDHYIDYVGGRSPYEVVPTQILAKLRQASYLFLGYKLSDWRLRAFLQWIWQGETLGRATKWAVERNPGVLEERFWQSCGASLYTTRLADYFLQLDSFLERRGRSA
jgi:hypothetical protein